MGLESAEKNFFGPTDYHCIPSQAETQCECKVIILNWRGGGGGRNAVVVLGVGGSRKRSLATRRGLEKNSWMGKGIRKQITLQVNRENTASYENQFNFS